MELVALSKAKVTQSLNIISESTAKKGEAETGSQITYSADAVTVPTQ